MLWIVHELTAVEVSRLRKEDDYAVGGVAGCISRSTANHAPGSCASLWPVRAEQALAKTRSRAPTFDKAAEQFIVARERE
ncbi:MAG: hypothetical protein EOO32_01320 [Comamonadaceae bacterium]|nr:MAG: hypothetical protein EOO32_01320 [Comamonadaceae bacterium]